LNDTIKQIIIKTIHDQNTEEGILIIIHNINSPKPIKENSPPAVANDPMLFPTTSILLHSPTHYGNDVSCFPADSIIIKNFPAHEIMERLTIYGS
jgi:hypothetical protein